MRPLCQGSSRSNSCASRPSVSFSCEPMPTCALQVATCLLLPFSFCLLQVYPSLTWPCSIRDSRVVFLFHFDMSLRCYWVNISERKKLRCLFSLQGWECWCFVMKHPTHLCSCASTQDEVAVKDKQNRVGPHDLFRS